MESPTVQPKEGRESEATDPRVLSPRLPSAPVVGRSRFCGFRDFADLVDKWLSTGLFGQLFRLVDSGHPDAIEGTSFFREIRAGLTTFATMAYIIAVNASILSQTGGTCACSLTDKFQCDTIPDYVDCKEEVRRDLITATAALAGISSLCFGLFTNLPVALAPGMGLNAYFAYQVVGSNGSGAISYRTALTAVFFEGLIFMFLALTGMRQWLVRLIPATIKTATGVGIGFFLTEIGLSYSSGIGAITGGGISTPLSLGGCPSDMINAVTGACNGGQMTNPTMWLAIFCGGIVTAFLMAFRVKYALVIGIALVSIISWPRNTPVTYFPDTPEGDSRFSFFKQIVAWHPLSKTLNQLDWNLDTTSTTHFVLALFTFLYVDIIDATATLYSMVRFCGVVNPKDGDFPAQPLHTAPTRHSYPSDLCLDALPLRPSSKAARALRRVDITQVNWRYIGDVLPSFVVMTFIPFSYSVAYGLIAGLFVYTTLNGLIGLVVFLSGNRIEPREYDLKEYWTWRGSGRAPWFVRAMRKGDGHDSPSSGDSHNNNGNTTATSSVPGEEESQRGFNIQHDCDNLCTKGDSGTTEDHSGVHFCQDEDYDYHRSSPLRGIAR
ncbi:hypothetical protein TrVFT333_011535 [Trichoderma virens FT-333]|nr:hypothetical protein TrVFT333_011535 [Trichoderma virens FT-333]